MTRNRKEWLVVIFYAIIVFGVALISCAPACPQPIIHPVAGTHLMMIPKGTQIGKQVAPENGIYIGESLTRPQPPQEQPKPKKKNFNYDKTADKIDI